MAIRYFKHTARNSTFRDEPIDHVAFEGVSDKPDSWGDHPAGTVSVYPGSEVPNSLSPNSFYFTGSRGELFTHVPPKIEDAFTDKSIHTAVAPVLLGLAYNEARKTGIPTYSSSLSKDSSRLVRHAMEKGLVVSNPENDDGRQTNTVATSRHNIYKVSRYELQDFNSSADTNTPVVNDFTGHATWSERVSDEDRKAAINTVRNAVRPPRQTSTVTNPQQFEQLRFEV